MKPLLMTLLCSAAFLRAEPAPIAETSQPTPVERHFHYQLWEQPPAGARSTPAYQESVLYRDNDPAKPRITQVTDPDIEVFLPEAGKTCTAAVLICPGGGYAVLAYDHEGLQVARWFNERGIAAAILKYRLPSSAIMEDPSIGPLQDAQEALRVLRRHAVSWGFPSDKIGVMGFSAGGHLAGSLSTRHAESVYAVADTVSARPDFSILVYGVLSMQPELTHKGSQINLLGVSPSQTAIDRASNELRVNSQTPPSFLIHSQDDGAVPVANSLRYLQALLAHGVPAELHVHEKGGHGYGLGVNPGSPDHWPRDLEAWLKRHGWMFEERGVSSE